MLKFFNATNPIIYAVGALLCLAQALTGLNTLELSELTSGEPWFNLFVQPFGTNNIAYLIVNVIFVLAGGLLLNFLLINHKVLSKITYLPYIVYILCCSFTIEQTQVSEILLLNLITLLVLDLIFQYPRSNEPKSITFFAGLLVGIGSFIAVEYLMCGILIGTAIILYRTFNIRHWLVLIIGLATPYIFLASGYYVLADINDLLAVKMVFHTPSMLIEKPGTIASIIVVLAILLLSTPNYLSELLNNTATKRKSLNLLAILFAFGIIAPFFRDAPLLESMNVLAIPLTVILSNFFIVQRRKKLVNVAFLIFLSVTVLRIF